MNISFAGVGNLYRFLRIEQLDRPAANQFRDFLSEVSSMRLNQNEQKARLLSAVQKVNALAETLKAKPEYSHVRGVNHEVTAFQSEGGQLFNELKNLNRPSTLQLIGKTVTLAAQYFPVPAEVEQVLFNEAVRQQTAIKLDAEHQEAVDESAKLCRGLIGFYEIIMKRPDLQTMGAGGRYQFLMNFPHFLEKMIPTFTTNRESEGIHYLKVLSQGIRKYKDPLKALCFQSPETEHFIERLSVLGGQEVEVFYNKLKKSLLSQCSEEVTPMSYILEEAGKISAEIPFRLKGNPEQAARLRAHGFVSQFEHGNGARISGVETGAGVAWGHEVFGHGITGDLPEIQISAFNHSLGILGNPKTVEKARRHQQEIVDHFYKHHKLAACRLIVNTENGVAVEDKNKDDNLLAAVTINTVVGYEIAKHNRDRGLLFELDAREMTKLKEVKTKEVMLFGIKNDIFASHILSFLLKAYRLDKDPDVGREVVKAAARFLVDKMESEEKFNPIEEQVKNQNDDGLDAEDPLDMMRLFDQLTLDSEINR